MKRIIDNAIRILESERGREDFMSIYNDVYIRYLFSTALNYLQRISLFLSLKSKEK